MSCLPGRCQEIRTIICVSVFPGNPAVLQWLPPSVLQPTCEFNLCWTGFLGQLFGVLNIPQVTNIEKHQINKVIPIANAIPGFHFHGFPWISMDFNAVQMIPSCKLTWMLNAHNKCRSFLQGNQGFSTSFCMFTRDILWISYGFPMDFTELVKIPFFAAEATKGLVIPARVHQPLETRSREMECGGKKKHQEG